MPDGAKINYHEVGLLREKFRKQTSDYILNAINSTSQRLEVGNVSAEHIEGIEKYVVREEFNIVKHYGDSDVEVQTVRLGDSQSVITNREIQNKVFEGWYSDPEFTHKSDMMCISTDKEIYSKYIPLVTKSDKTTFISKVGKKIKSKRLRRLLKKLLKFFRKIFKGKS